MPCFLDSNILMYAAGKEHPYRGPCREAIRAIAEDRLSVVTNAEILQEILYRYDSIGRREDGFATVADAVSLCEVVFPVRREEIDSAIDLMKKHASLAVRDAIHIASMLNNGIGEILSTDTDLDDVPDIARVDPRLITGT